MLYNVFGDAAGNALGSRWLWNSADEIYFARVGQMLMGGRVRRAGHAGRRCRSRGVTVGRSCVGCSPSIPPNAGTLFSVFMPNVTVGDLPLLNKCLQ